MKGSIAIRTVVAAAESTAKLVAAVLVSFFLFVAIATLHGVFGVDRKMAGTGRQGTQVMAELIKEKPREERQVRQRIRQVQQAQQSGERGPGKMAMRFAPDLAVDAGGGGGEGVALQGQELSAEVFEEGLTDEAPQEERMPPVNFPDRARELGIAGAVVAKFAITFDGRAAAVDIVSSPSSLLSAEVRRVLAGAKFKPARNKGIPVNIRATKTFEFSLD